MQANPGREGMKILGLLELLEPDDDKENTEGENEQFMPPNTKQQTPNTKYQIPVKEPLLEAQTTWACRAPGTRW